MSKFVPKKLYLPRADKFEDTFEGRIPIRKVRELSENNLVKKLDAFSEKSLTKSTYISSWSIDENETYSLWKIYSDYRSAVAIKSNIERLINSIKDNEKEQYIGLVNYINPNRNYNYYGNTYQFFFEKREYFKFENEARIVTSLRYNDSKELLLLPEGIKINIDLDELIDEIYLAPKADQNFKSLIELKLSSLNLNKTVRFSDI